MLTGATAMTVTGFITEVGNVFTAAMGWLSDVGTAIAGDGILLCFVAVPLIGLGIGIFKRLLNVN